MGHLYDACAKTSYIALIKIMMSSWYLNQNTLSDLLFAVHCTKLSWAIIFALSLRDMLLAKTFWLMQENLCK